MGKNLLRTARKAAMRAAKRQLEGCGSSPSLRVNKTDEPDPGQSIRCAIEVRVLLEKQEINGQVYDANGTVVSRSTLTSGPTVLPRVDGVPRYKDFNTIRKNHHVKDEEVLRYVPYFGETDDVDLSETYKVEVRSVGEEEDLECIPTGGCLTAGMLTEGSVQDSLADCGAVFTDSQYHCRPGNAGSQ